MNASKNHSEQLQKISEDRLLVYTNPQAYRAIEEDLDKWSQGLIEAHKNIELLEQACHETRFPWDNGVAYVADSYNAESVIRLPEPRFVAGAIR